MQKFDLAPARTQSGPQPDISAGVRRVTPAIPLVAACVMLFALSGGALWLAGLNYEGLSGSAASKIHPSTYLLFALFGWATIASGNPVGHLVRLSKARPAGLLLLVVALLMFVHIVARGAPGMAGVVDTYMAAAIAVLLLADAGAKTLKQIEIAIHILMFINALLGLVEFAGDFRLFPYRFDGEVFPTDLRSTALQGHPLANATVASFYVLALVGNGRFSLNANLRAPLVALQFMSLVAFGGRSGLVLAVVLGGARMLSAAHRRLRSGRIALPVAALVIFVLTLAPLAAGGMVAGGFFDRLAARFASDGGSAYARVLMFDLFDRISLAELLVGPDAAYMDSIRRVAGLEWGIEHPVVHTILYHGLAMATLLTVAVALFLAELARVSARGIAWPMICFVLLLNTFESIGGKTAILTKFAVTMLCLYRPEPGGQGFGIARPRAAIMAGSNARVASSIRPMPSNKFQNAQPKPPASAASRTSRT